MKIAHDLTFRTQFQQKSKKKVEKKIEIEIYSTQPSNTILRNQYEIRRLNKQI